MKAGFIVFLMRILTAVALLFSLSGFVAAQECPSTCSCGMYGTEQGASGPAQYVVCMPPANNYNGRMILFAHGYIAQGSPEPATWLSQLALPDGTALPTLLNGQGFGFAASSFSTDGLAILQGIQDTKALINVIGALDIPVQKYFVTGASEGGLVAAKSIEENPRSYAGGLAVCGPVGGFQKQLNYFGDVRVLFDYFFPGVLTSAGGTAIDIPPALINNWFTQYEPAVIEAVNSHPLATLQLVNTAQIEIGLTPSNAASAIADVLWYNVFATSNAQAVLGGNPYDNTNTVYRGSFDDARLNGHVERYAATGTALSNIATSYETTGLLYDPLVTLHTLADPIVPFWQEPLYAAKVRSQGSISELVEIPALAYGHCNVNAAQAKTALSVLLLKAGQ
jgi:hypothetical protein